MDEQDSGGKNKQEFDSQSKIDEREDGEIIDDTGLEDIISSDEEFTMMQRIKELEATNAEMEKIVNISNFDYGDDYDNLSYPLESLDDKILCENDHNYSNNDSYPSLAIKKRLIPLETSEEVRKRRHHHHHHGYHSSHHQQQQEIDYRHRYDQDYPYSTQNTKHIYHDKYVLLPEDDVSMKIRSKHRKRKYQKDSRDRYRKRSKKRKKSSHNTPTLLTSNSESDSEMILNREKLKIALKRDTYVPKTKENYNYHKGTLKVTIGAQNSNELNTKVRRIIDIISDDDVEVQKQQKSIKTEVQIDDNNSNNNDNTMLQIERNENSDGSSSLEEQELRLIALKSAVMKRHLARKKRCELTLTTPEYSNNGTTKFCDNDDKPYSPSDFLEFFDLCGSNSGNVNSPISIPSNTVTETIVESFNNSMDISPITSPESIQNYNFNDSDCMLKPIDMDLATTSSSSNPSPIFDNELKNEMTEQINQDICDLIRNEILPNPGKMIDINEEEKLGKSPIVGDAENEKLIIRSNSITNTAENDSGSTDEEEFALRAFLLAKMNTLKSQNNYNHKDEVDLVEQTNNNHAQILKKENICQNGLIEESTKNSIHENDDLINRAQQLEELILNALESRSVVNRTEFVLKEAVRRLQKKNPSLPSILQSLPEQSQSNEEQSISQDHWDTSNQSFQNSPVHTSLNYSFSNLQLNNEINSIENQQLDHVTLVNSLTENVENVDLKLANSCIENIEITNSIDSSNKNQQIPDTNVILPQVCDEALISVDIDNKSMQNHDEVKENQSQLLSLPQEILPKKIPKLSNVAVTKSKQHSLNNSKISHVPSASSISPSLSPLPHHKDQQKTDLIKSTEKSKLPTKSILQKSTSASTEITNKTSSVIQSVTNNNTTQSSQLTTNRNVIVTKFQMPKVEKLVIRLNDDSSSSEFEIDNYYDDVRKETENLNKDLISTGIDATVYNNHMNKDDYDKLPQPKITIKKEVVNDIFQAKLDEFLKSARSKVDQSKKSVDSTSTQLELKTPTAVCHLPPSSQLEYQRLLNRMKMLEKQKQTRNESSQKNENDNNKTTIEDGSDNKNIFQEKKTLIKSHSDKKLTDLSTKEKETILKNTTQHKQLKCIELPFTSTKNDEIIKNDKDKECLNTDKTEGVEVETKPNQETVQASENENQKQSKHDQSLELNNKMKLLDTYEKNITKRSSMLLDNFQKAIDLVVIAQKEKLRKCLLQKKLEILRKETKLIESGLENQNKKLAKLYPQISHSHKTIISLKKKYSNLNAVTANLGKSLHGNNYRSKSSDKNTSIASKSAHLSSEIKKLKNYNPSNLEDQIALKWLILNKNKKKSESDENNVPKSKSLEVSSSVATKRNNIHIETLTDKCKSILSKNTNDQEVGGKECVNADNKCCVEKMSQKSEAIFERNSTNDDDVSCIQNELQQVNADEIGKSNKDVTLEEKITHHAVKELNPTKTQQLTNYVSPLDNIQTNSSIDPNGIICPYELMGECSDKECRYIHLKTEQT